MARTGSHATGQTNTLPQIDIAKLQATASHVPGITVAENLFVEAGVQMQVSDTPVTGQLYHWQPGDSWQSVLSTLYPDKYPAPPATLTPEQQQLLSDDVKVIAMVTARALMAQEGISLDDDAGRQKFHDLVDAAVTNPGALGAIALPGKDDQARMVAQRLHPDADHPGQIVDVRQQRLIAQYAAILHDKTKDMTPEQVHNYLRQHLEPRPGASDEEIQRARTMQAQLDTVWQRNVGHETEFVADLFQSLARNAAAPRDAERREHDARSRPTRTFAAIPTEILTTPRTSPQAVTGSTSRTLAGPRLKMGVATGPTASSVSSTTRTAPSKTSSTASVGAGSGSPSRTVTVRSGQALSVALQQAGLPHDKATLESIRVASNGKIKNVNLVQPGTYVVPAGKGGTAASSSADVVDIPDLAPEATAQAGDNSAFGMNALGGDAAAVDDYYMYNAWQSAMASTMDKWNASTPKMPDSASPYDDDVADTDRDLLGAIGQAQAKGNSRAKAESVAAKGFANQVQAEANVQKKQLDHVEDDQAHERKDISRQVQHNNDTENANADLDTARLSKGGDAKVPRTPFPTTGRST